ncbi:MAG: 4Fe-4S dicluster domain-containing protein [Candidatus Dadabacteria bacterium]|nr:4Fe-4S dicluster domain-containing protein [Candidatus Dadabacteria bacterium]NIS07874.1 4Fe-4S dicluster domain-containing protein [Candidatus Dadabacteria bacterium]NIV42894.1 4Fe-4S dicluster domain-containing protein [Candidatus Dadabacteria bacterium]NIX14864.1 4Fe-4S dicluster domain-containing protein [Candidatus Dadabacteria bacterium]NIY21478.1 4Fe-4S dicluster domain-containing protein [Candidatus Dadabacteria bacterium]
MAEDKLTKSVQQRYHSFLKEHVNPHEWAYAWRSELNKGGFKAVDFLMEEIVDTGKCVGCAACVTICPTDVFDYKDENPVDTRNDACVFCELCADVCPVLRPPDNDLINLLEFKKPIIDEGFGPYNYAVIARAKDPEFLQRGQDGGVTSALLVHALNNGSINGAVLGDVLPENPQVGIHKLATTPKEIIDCSGSRYTYSPNTVALTEAMRRDIRPIAVVGVPCQVDGVRQQQHSSIRLEVAKWYEKNINLVIGLFCSEAFTHEHITLIAEHLNVEPKDIVNVNVKGKVIITLSDGREVIMPLKDFHAYARPACLYCLDYAADNADIGVGGIGLSGWTFVAVRTEAGHKAFQAAVDDDLFEIMPVDEQPRAKSLLIKLSEIKRNKPLPALMPTLQERIEMGNTNPKTFYKDYNATNGGKK